MAALHASFCACRYDLASTGGAATKILTNLVGILDAPHDVRTYDPLEMHFDIADPSTGWDVHVAGTFSYCDALYESPVPCE